MGHQVAGGRGPRRYLQPDRLLKVERPRAPQANWQRGVGLVYCHPLEADLGLPVDDAGLAELRAEGIEVDEATAFTQYSHRAPLVSRRSS